MAYFENLVSAMTLQAQPILLGILGFSLYDTERPAIDGLQARLAPAPNVSADAGTDCLRLRSSSCIASECAYGSKPSGTPSPWHPPPDRPAHQPVPLTRPGNAAYQNRRGHRCFPVRIRHSEGSLRRRFSPLVRRDRMHPLSDHGRVRYRLNRRQTGSQSLQASCQSGCRATIRGLRPSPSCRRACSFLPRLVPKSHLIEPLV